MIRAFFLMSLFVVVSTKIVSAADLTLFPSSGTYEVGSTFSMIVYVSGNSVPINGISGGITFSNDTLELTSISKSGSILPMWAEAPTFSNTTGKVSFEGVISNPGFNGSEGKVITLNFKAKNAGTGSVTLTSGSVLANDGNATNVLGSLGFASFNITGGENTSDSVSTTPKSSGTTPVIVSPSYPDSSKWYNKKEASFEWTLPPSATAVRTLYNEKEISTPTKVYDPPIDNRSFMVDADGVNYMHVQFKTSSGWGTIYNYKFQVDTENPESLKVSFPDGIVTTNPTPTVLVLAEDKVSGIASISMSVDGGDEQIYTVDPSNLYRVPKQSAGQHTLVVTAFDGAGNKSSVSLDYTIQSISVPVITEYTKNVELGKELRITGTTYPQSTVEVVLTGRDGISKSETTTSDNAGIFKLIWSKEMETGVYEMKARAVDSKGASSDYTDEKIIVVEYIAFIRFGIFVMNWLSLILILIIAVFATIATFWFSLTSFGKWRRKVHRTLLEAENTLKANVQGLRQDTEEFHDILIKVKKTRKLNKNEEMMLKKFKKRLEITEKEIENKLEAIG